MQPLSTRNMKKDEADDGKYHLRHHITGGNETGYSDGGDLLDVPSQHGDVLLANISSILKICGFLKTTLGPFGMDKLIRDEGTGEVLISNDGATLMKYLIFAKQDIHNPVSHELPSSFSPFGSVDQVEQHTSGMQSSTKVLNPISILLSQLSQTQDDHVGDGTTSVVLFCGELLRQALHLIQTFGIHPRLCIENYRYCLDLCLKYINGHKVAIPSNPQVLNNLLFSIANTALSSKLLASTSGSHLVTKNEHKSFSHICELCVDIIQHFCRRNTFPGLKFNPEKHLIIVKSMGYSVQQTSFYQDSVLISFKVSNPSVLNDMIPKSLDDKIPIVICKVEEFGTFRSKIYGARIRVSSHEQGHEVSSFERSEIRKLCGNICKNIFQLPEEVNTQKKLHGVVLNGFGISQIARDEFARYGVLAIGNLDYDLLDQICQCLDTSALISLSEEGSTPPCHVHHVEYISYTNELDDDSFCFLKLRKYSDKQTKISAPPSKVFCGTLLIRAPTVSILDECERSINDALKVLSVVTGKNGNHIIGGAGSMYISLAHHIQKEIQKLEKQYLMQENQQLYQTKDNSTILLAPLFTGKDKLIMEAFCKSLQTIPSILCQNAGLDSSEVLASLWGKIKSAPSDDRTFYGVDLNSGNIIPTLDPKQLCLSEGGSTTQIKGDHIRKISQMMIIEPSNILESILKSAVDAAEMVMRIDQNIIVQPKPSAYELGLV